MKRVKEKVSIEFEIEYDEIQWGDGWIPKTVYKYRNWENSKHQTVLREQSIWVADTFDFNDPFDCNIPIAYDLMTEDDALAEKFMRRLVYELKQIPDNEKEETIEKFVREGKHKDKSFIHNFKYSSLAEHKKFSGVFSVTPINNNILMWSHYANSHKGFCVGYDSSKLFAYLGGGGNINYQETYPIISPAL